MSFDEQKCYQKMSFNTTFILIKIISIPIKPKIFVSFNETKSQ